VWLGKQGHALSWELDKTIDQGSSLLNRQAMRRASTAFHLELFLLFSFISLSYLDVGRELGHAGFQGKGKYLFLPLS